MKKNINERGVTLLDLTIYMVAILLIIGIMASIRGFFFKNIDVVKETSRYASEYDSFNANIVYDSKNSDDVIVNGTKIIFGNGVIYTYNSTDKAIYKNSSKISDNVYAFVVSKRISYINNTKKQIVSVNIIIGNSSKTQFSKSVDYTLKYW